MDNLIRPLEIVLLTALVYGWIECYIMEHGFSTGAPDLVGTFNAAYHGAMFVLFCLICYGCRAPWWSVFWWALLEDLAFWAASKWGPHRWFSYKYKLTKDSWIAKMMSSFRYKNIMVPVVHVVLFILGLTFYLGGL